MSKFNTLSCMCMFMFMRYATLPGGFLYDEVQYFELYVYVHVHDIICHFTWVISRLFSLVEQTSRQIPS